MAPISGLLGGSLDDIIESLVTRVSGGDQEAYVQLRKLLAGRKAEDVVGQSSHPQVFQERIGDVMARQMADEYGNVHPELGLDEALSGQQPHSSTAFMEQVTGDPTETAKILGGQGSEVGVYSDLMNDPTKMDDMIALLEAGRGAGALEESSLNFSPNLLKMAEYLEAARPSNPSLWDDFMSGSVKPEEIGDLMRQARENVPSSTRFLDNELLPWQKMVAKEAGLIQGGNLPLESRPVTPESLNEMIQKLGARKAKVGRDRDVEIEVYNPRGKQAYDMTSSQPAAKTDSQIREDRTDQMFQDEPWSEEIPKTIQALGWERDRIRREAKRMKIDDAPPTEATMRAIDELEDITPKALANMDDSERLALIEELISLQGNKEGARQTFMSYIGPGTSGDQHIAGLKRVNQQRRQNLLLKQRLEEGSATGSVEGEHELLQKFIDENNLHVRGIKADPSWVDKTYDDLRAQIDVEKAGNYGPAEGAKERERAALNRVEALKDLDAHPSMQQAGTSRKLTDRQGNVTGIVDDADTGSSRYKEFDELAAGTPRRRFEGGIESTPSLDQPILEKAVRKGILDGEMGGTRIFNDSDGFSFDEVKSWIDNGYFTTAEREQLWNKLPAGYQRKFRDAVSKETSKPRFIREGTEITPSRKDIEELDKLQEMQGISIKHPWMERLDAKRTPSNKRSATGRVFPEQASPEEYGQTIDPLERELTKGSLQTDRDRKLAAQRDHYQLNPRAGSPKEAGPVTHGTRETHPQHIAAIEESYRNRAKTRKERIPDRPQTQKKQGKGTEKNLPRIRKWKDAEEHFIWKEWQEELFNTPLKNKSGKSLSGLQKLHRDRIENTKSRKAKNQLIKAGSQVILGHLSREEKQRISRKLGEIALEKNPDIKEIVLAGKRKKRTPDTEGIFLSGKEKYNREGNKKILEELKRIQGR